MIEPGFKGNLKHRFAFKINKFNKNCAWVAVGVCLKNVILENKFEFLYGQVEHGIYGVSGNGYSWSHLNKD